jgi:site-specific DNA-methyltransferase (adenine-specific)
MPKLKKSGDSMKLRISEIKIGQRFREDIGDIESLAQSIKEIGLLQPLVVNEQNVLIVGHRRLEACKLLGWEEIPVIKLNFDDSHALRAQIDENEMRKSYTAKERVAIGLAFEKMEKEKAKERKAHGLTAPGKSKNASEKFTEAFEKEKGEALEKVARIVGWSRPTYEEAKAVVEAAESDPKKYGDLIGTMEAVSVHAAYKELVRRQELEKRKAESMQVELKNLILGDAIEKVLEIPNGLVDLLITDPPYGETQTGSSSRGRTSRIRENWDFAEQRSDRVFQMLDALFERVKPKLKPNAHIYIFTNWKSWSRLEEIAEKYFEVLNCLIVPYPRMSLGPRDTGYRRSYTMIMFASNGEERKLTRPNQPDVIQGMDVPDFKYHPAEKSVELLKYLISNSTIEGELVLDPFCGSGSTLVAAEELGRRWIGIEIEQKWYEVAKARVSEVLKNVKR